MSRSERKFKNFLIAPRFQLKICAYFIVSGLITIGAMIGMVYDRLLTVRAMMTSGELMDFATQNQINEIMFEIAEISLIGFSAYIIFTFIVALLISHRIAGPVVAINAFIDELMKGNYDYSRRLRPRDELLSIMDKLHELAPIVKDKAGNV